MKKWDVNAVDFTGNTTLTWESQIGREEFIRVVLRRMDVNHDHTETEYARTSISQAAEKGHKGVIKLLLERGEVNPERADKSGKAALGWAVVRGHKGVVKVLLECGNFNLDREDKSTKTPLAWAVKEEHEEIVNILSEPEDVNPSQAQEEVVEALLEQVSFNSTRQCTRRGRGLSRMVRTDEQILKPQCELGLHSEHDWEPDSEHDSEQEWEYDSEPGGEPDWEPEGEPHLEPEADPEADPDSEPDWEPDLELKGNRIRNMIRKLKGNLIRNLIWNLKRILIQSLTRSPIRKLKENRIRE